MTILGQATAGLVNQDDDYARPELLAGQRDGSIGIVHSWELVTAVDGPGTRLTIFLAGCPLRCLYCHNPDTMQKRSGTPVHIADIVARMKRYLPIFRATGGGITLSGGEALMQGPFVARVLEEAKNLGIHTALDTSGYLGRVVTPQMAANIDLVLLDIKSGDEQIYRHVTGRELKPTLEFARRLAQHGVTMWIRYVLVPTLTDAIASYGPVAEFTATLGHVERVEILPFHQMGAGKWEELGMDYTLADVQPPSPELIESVRQYFKQFGLLTY